MNTRNSNLRRGFGRVALALGALLLPALPSYGADVYLVAREFTKTMPGQVDVTMWGFAVDSDSDLSTVGAEVPTAPGPMITVADNDSILNIHLRNDLTVPVSIVIPGQNSLLAPVRFIDATGRQRVQSFTQETAPGAVATYAWNGLQSGTYLYHSGTHPAVQVQMGLYGGVKKDSAPGVAYSNTPYDREAVFFYSEIDPAMHAAVAGGTYGTPAYPSTFNYRPTYFLVNGEPFTAGQAPVASVSTNEKVLLRFLNAGLETHVPALEGSYMKVVAEDGNAYPRAREQYSVPLAAGKTADAVFTPVSEGTYPVFDRRLFLTNAGTSPGGMVSYLEVAGVNGAPVAVSDSYTVAEDSQLTVAAAGVLTNDTDPNSDPLTSVLATTVNSGTLTLNGDGSFTYQPSANFAGTDFFQYRASDGTLLSNTAIAGITVTPVNDAPTAANDTVSTMQDTELMISPLVNDTDLDGDALSVANLTNGANGTTSVHMGTMITYMPNPGFFGTDSFTYTAFDGALASNAATVTVTVIQVVNAAPVAVNDYATTRRNTPVNIAVLGNDSDSDGTLNTSSVAIVVRPTRGGTAAVNANGTITFTPRLNFRGTDTFTYTVRDNRGAISNQAVVRVNVTR